MKKQKWIRKGMAFVLSLAMVAGLVPAMSGGANKVQAASGSGTEPSVSAYATKAQLMDDTYAPNAEGTAANYGKIVFGKNSDGTTAQEWYILGKDEGVSGDNTIIFAASPIATGQKFSSSSDTKTYNYEAGTGYEESAGSKKVYPNHYGASDLRVALQRMLEDESGNAVETYFSEAEQDLMNATTVTTNDTKNSATYTTTDKLYALAADGEGSTYKTIKAGTSDSTVLAMSSYWSIFSYDSYFWLRSPYADNDEQAKQALYAVPGDHVSSNYVYFSDGGAVRPASNLNLSSVLFASSAKAASSDTVSGTIADGKAMTLRLNGTGKNIGTVNYNSTTGDIKVAKGSTSKTVALIVQGNDGTDDWYYSKRITETEIVKVSDIVAESNTPSSIDLSTCKIWLEITDTDGLIYAACADKEIEPINTTYVTKEQLMNSFKPYSDGTAVNYGKLVFGKNSSGTAQEWYILGKDAGVSGDNTIIFAASPIATERVFEDDWENNKTESSLWSDCDYSGVSITEVYSNHYGASDLRVALKSMATNTSHFTKAEQGLMNATTVTTDDTNKSVTYTTTDKLYALQGNYSDKKLWAGTSDSTVLAMSSYWSNGAKFWLRSPFDYSYSAALLAFPGVSGGFDGVSNEHAVQPVSNLNLSSVLFASSAKAASSDTVSGTLTDGTAMTLRFDGTGKDIGTVTYNTTTGDINVAKGSTEGDVALVVQGNDGTNDWYYSKQITGTEIVKVSDIVEESNTPSSIDLSTCKIWLEITEDGLIYAEGAYKETEKINTTYVTKEQLMNSFKPNSDGTAVNYGKLVFGKNSYGDPQKWHILGKDEGISGDNTIIFATSSIAELKKFDDAWNNKTESSLWSDCDYSGVSITDVYSNHYGASDFRVGLKEMATNTSYFTKAEQGLMNATTVTTKDWYNDVTYTTTDKLYALQGDRDHYDQKLWAGTSDSTVLVRSSYWSDGVGFWLRTPYFNNCDDDRLYALHADPYDGVNRGNLNDCFDVRPASNLNLSSVLFASSAETSPYGTVSGTLTGGTAMTLRLNGTGKDIGTVTYNTTTGDIMATKGSTSQTVFLVVQGKGTVNGEEKDWYYSKVIKGSETVNASAIKSELSLSSDINLSEDINLSDCKIWLETTDEDGMIYAVGANLITSVEITDIDTPVSNTALDTKASCATTGVSSTTPQITWTPSDSTAGYNTIYTASITLTAVTDYEFTDYTTATVLGYPATSVTKNADGTLTVTYAFPATAKDKLISITPPQAITVANGTAYDAMNLPATVNIVTEGNTKSSAQVTWNTTKPASGSYDPAVLTEQTVTLWGKVTCPKSIDNNRVSLNTTITITISATEIVQAPTANPPAGTYSENQSVTLTSSTEGATIYYTTDGSEPTLTGSEPSGTTQVYTTPISVTGIEKQSITTTIKAIAVKNGMQDSSVETFTYTIHIPVSKYTYATKTQLMDGTFAPDAYGTVENIGKLVFGKNSSGNPQEWYILGKDVGVSGDNTIIFAASPIATGQKFEDDSQSNKTDTSLWSDCDYKGVSITEVNASHYGASDLRVALKSMADGSNETYFTTAEQGLMNATKVTTMDWNNDVVTYTTTDKLYALQKKTYSSEDLCAGSGDKTVLAMNSYWSIGGNFWLRTPHSNYSVYSARPGDRVSSCRVDYGLDVRPASNLNLSSVLFASSAKAASSDTVSGTLTDGTAMTLRFDGTGKDIGTVTYNNTTGDIKATQGSTEGNVALVVQGKDGTNNWYYSKQITGTEVVNVTDIVSESNTPASIDLSDCKIWLETTDSTNNLTYAVEATETTIVIIHSVAITGIDTPVSKTALDNEAACVTTGVSSAKPHITWTPNDSTAGYNKSYTASITLTADTGYEFTDSTTATVLDNSATSVNKNTDGTLTVTYDFPATDKDKLTSITAPQPITVANGTAYSAMNLPEQVNIVTDGNTVSSAPVKWDTTTPADGSYDTDVLTQQTVTLTGTVTCPDSIDANEVSLTTTITITISEADTVKAPTANPPAGAYTKNQSVTLTSDTAGATIYYTTDGSEPTITGGMLGGTTAEYTAPIAVTGTEGQSTTTTIKAIAVKDRMQNSSVETFTYTIQIPDAPHEHVDSNNDGICEVCQKRIWYIVSPSSMLLERGVSVSNISMNPVDGKVKVGEKVTVTTNDMLGYRFKGWYLDSDIADYQLSDSAAPQATSFTYTFKPEDNMSLVAVYEAAGNADVKISGSGFTVSVDDGAASAVQDGTYSEKLSIGSKVTITIVEENSNFINWSNENNKIVSSERTYTFTVTGQTTLTMSKKGTTGSTAMVEFVSAYNQVISGKIYSSTDTIIFPDGPSKMGYTFKNWSLTQDEIQTKIKDGEIHITVTPVYEQDTSKTYTVTVYVDGVQDNTQTATGILAGTTKTVKAPTVDGRVFLYWTDADGNILGYDPSYFMQVNKDIVVKAVYGEAAVEAKPVIAMTNVFTTSTGGKNKISFTVTRDIPEGYTLVEHGVLYNKLGTIDNPSEETFVLGGTGVSKYTSTATKLSGIVTLNVNMTGALDTKVVARGYMIVKNSEGKDEIYYSDYAHISYNEKKTGRR